MSEPGRSREELPVEPLPDLTWQRIERRLFAGGAVRAEQAAQPSGSDSPM